MHLFIKMSSFLQKSLTLNMNVDEKNMHLDKWKLAFLEGHW